MNLHVSLYEIKNKFMLRVHICSLNDNANGRKVFKQNIYTPGMFAKNKHRGGCFTKSKQCGRDENGRIG